MYFHVWGQGSINPNLYFPATMEHRNKASPVYLCLGEGDYLEEITVMHVVLSW